MKNFDPHTGIWPEVAHYSIMVSDDILEVFALMDKSLDNHLLDTYPMLEKAILANFHYLFPNGFTTAYGDANTRVSGFGHWNCSLPSTANISKQRKKK